MPAQGGCSQYCIVNVTGLYSHVWVFSIRFVIGKEGHTNGYIVIEISGSLSEVIVSKCLLFCCMFQHRVFVYVSTNVSEENLDLVHFTLKMEAACASETLVSTNLTARYRSQVERSLKHILINVNVILEAR
jgi:hypothetical protein